MEEQRKHIEEPAASLLLAYVRETASAEECRIVENWLKDNDENEQTLLQIARIYHVQYTHRRIEQRDSLKAFEQVKEQIRRRVWQKNIYRISVAVACIAVGFFLSNFLSWWNITRPEPEAQMVTVCSNPGMRTSCQLPDGTMAYLNSGSTLIYPALYDKDKRAVTLDGEGYFKVARDPGKPFIVSVADGKMRVKVLGTEFNLQAYKEEGMVQTTLVSGSVSIDILKSGKIVSGTNLKPSERAVFEISSGKVSIVTVNTEYDTAWKDGRLMFKDTPISQVLRRLSYFYNVRFDVRDSVINTYCFTGTFQNKQLAQILDYLKISSQIDYTIQQIISDDSSGIQYETVVLDKMR